MKKCYFPIFALLPASLIANYTPAKLDGRSTNEGVLKESDIDENDFMELLYLPGHTRDNSYHSQLPHTYILKNDLPPAFNWGNVDGISYLTRSLNQHLPHYCGSCWAHGALSSLADRIKIARQAAGEDIHLSVQYILNCGSEVAGSCLGGSHTGVYEFIHETGFVPYDTCQPYVACSYDSSFGFCKKVDTTCSNYNTCRTCDMSLKPSFRHPLQVVCSEIDIFPNATVDEYGTYKHEQNQTMVDLEVVHQIKSEILARGPVAAEVNGKALRTYQGGVYSNMTESRIPTHVVSIVGWGTTLSTTDGSCTEYWICRNSWGEYWGEMGYFRIGPTGYNVLGIERNVAWATPGQFSVSNYPCAADGRNCVIKEDGLLHERAAESTVIQRYLDPSQNQGSIRSRLLGLNEYTSMTS